MNQQCYGIIRMIFYFFKQTWRKKKHRFVLIPSPHTCCIVEGAIVKLLTEGTLFLCFFLTTVNAYMEVENLNYVILCCSRT